jgi:hypothetical protein
MESSAYPIDYERILQQKTVRDPTARAMFLSAMREFGKEDGPFTFERLQQMTRIEEHFQALLLYDQLDFLREQASSPDGDRDFALNIQRICLEAANGFQRYLRTRNQWAQTQDAVDAMFRVTGLALHAIHCYVKWGYFLAEPGRFMPWKQLHALYSLGEADGYAQVPFVLHPAQPNFKPSVQSLYLRTLILDLLNSGNLSKVQIEIADGWFSSWCSDYALDTEYSSRKHLFCVDLASETGLHLMRKDSHGDSLRYIRADGLKAQIEEVQAGLRHGRLYAGFGAGAVFPVEEHVALLAIIEKLYDSILAGSENRIEERTHFEDREVDVAVGVDLVLRKILEGPRPAEQSVAVESTPSTDTIEFTPTGLSLSATTPATPSPASARDDPELGRWRVLDLSSKGFGLLVDRPTSETVLLNGVLGLRNQETGGWIVGQVVRKQPNRVRGEMLLGVEVLTYRPVPVELVRVGGGPNVQAIYMPGTDANGKLDSILVRIADFRSEGGFHLNAGGANYHLRLNRIIRKGADWIKVRFEIAARL